MKQYLIQVLHFHFFFWWSIVPLFLKSDSLEWLRSCHIKNPAIEIPSDLPYKALEDWVEEEGAEGALYRLQLKRYLLIFQVTKVSHVAKITRQLDVYQDRVKDMVSLGLVLLFDFVLLLQWQP